MTSLSLQTIHEVQTTLYQEALHLDAQRWDEWLGLFTEDAVFWLPAWTAEHRLSTSPERELSLIYCAARAGLEDRVPRTSHAVTNCVVTPDPDASEQVVVDSSWTCHVYELKQRTQHVFFGAYQHHLACRQGQWRITRKKVVLMNDQIPTMLDFYCI
jgi:3-phenylpropionate/cinnamic acid dioxygenase small subunit